MSKFIVVDVDNDCGHIDGVYLVFEGGTEFEAKDYIQKRRDEQKKSWELRREYVNEYVNNLVIPEGESVDYFLSKKFGYRHYGALCDGKELLDYFKECLLGYGYHGLKNLEDYDPPPAEMIRNTLFVLELKDE